MFRNEAARFYLRFDSAVRDIGLRIVGRKNLLHSYKHIHKPNHQTFARIPIASMSF